MVVCVVYAYNLTLVENCTVAICQILFSLLRLLHSVVTFCLVKYSQSKNEWTTSVMKTIRYFFELSGRLSFLKESSL